jgi:hypothetical protein
MLVSYRVIVSDESLRYACSFVVSNLLRVARNEGGWGALYLNTGWL